MKLIRHFRKYYNNLFVPPPQEKKLHNHCFQFLLGTENNDSAKISADGGGGGWGQKDNYNIF